MKIIITGAASGIGRAVTLRLAKLGGLSAVLADLNAKTLEETTGAARALGADVVSHACDIARVETSAALVDLAASRFDGLDAIVSNAGALRGALLRYLTVEDYEGQFAIHTRPTWLLGQAAYELLSRSRGCIVATASISAEHPTPPLGSYSASKAALVRLVEQMAIEWGPDGIRCNCVSPGPTLTPMNAHGYADEARRRHRENTIPLRRLGAPEDIAAAVTFLLSPEASFISGVNLAVDGAFGRNLMPASGAGTGQT
jgi:NAD(P)-dependent dehydrogenase (short-subunit alcohol dehydrogenase family)